MAKYRMVRTNLWKNPIIAEEMNPEDRLFYLYLLTNPYTTQIGIYRITKREIAFDLGYSLEVIESLMKRFIEEFKLIRYNPETRELAIKYWGEDNLHKGGKPIMDCIFSELKRVKDLSLIKYVSEAVPKQEIRSLYESFCNEKHHTYQNSEYEDLGGTSAYRDTMSGQKKKEKEKEKQKQKQKAFNPNIENNPYIESRLSHSEKTNDVKEIVEFWDNNGFVISNENGKQQLLSWLDDSSFLQPKEVILKALKIACANNKRKLNYVVGILKNWENECLLTVEEIDNQLENQKSVTWRKSTQQLPGGRDIPRGFELDLTAGEE
ncbi:DnaD domain-containing protein [Metabacillus halosaccharovorans]|uniref:DnaD domain-containing protein n=1 Tax=Metabacillus halosaccharovorans TaxID=930124 RepID=UPI0034CFEA29